MYAVINTFANSIHSRHRTAAAAFREQSSLARAVGRNRGAYLPTIVVKGTDRDMRDARVVIDERDIDGSLEGYTLGESYDV